MDADQILVMEGGEIVESGSHSELLAAEGRYKTLYDKQFRLEQNRFVNPGEDNTPESEEEEVTVDAPKDGLPFGGLSRS
jgi:ABC-type glutathione transport system ATPase component